MDYEGWRAETRQKKGAEAHRLPAPPTKEDHAYYNRRERKKRSRLPYSCNLASIRPASRPPLISADVVIFADQQAEIGSVYNAILIEVRVVVVAAAGNGDIAVV